MKMSSKQSQYLQKIRHPASTSKQLNEHTFDMKLNTAV